MRTKVVTCLVAGACVVGMASLALAQTNAPKSAKKFQSSLVAAYAPCTAPNNSTKTLPLPACNAVESDPSWRPLAWIAAEARRKLGLASGSTTKKEPGGGRLPALLL